MELEEKTYEIKNVTQSEISQILILNQNAIPHVNKVDVSFLEQAINTASYFFVVKQNTEVLGFLIAFDENQSYSSENYQFFQKNYNSFLYIDRIAINEEFQNLNIATELYNCISALAKDNFAMLCCEVNTVPKNIPSLKFHKKMGFHEVKSCQLNSEKAVVYMIKKLQ